MSQEHISFQDISKRFRATHALRKISFGIRRGAVHAVVGENGAGKSTLMNILCGKVRTDEGNILIDGKSAYLDTPAHSFRYGIAMIHQELSLVPNLTVAQNVLLGEEPCYRLPFVNWAEMKEQARIAINDLDLHISVDDIVATLPIGQQQMLEVIKALTRHARILIMDEPTSALSELECGVLFRVIKSLTTQGVTIIFISHHLDEIFTVCDWVTVLRDGQHIATERIRNIDQQQLVKMMVGKSVANIYTRQRNQSTGHCLLEVNRLTSAGAYRDISFKLHRGEILGIFGLLGAGKSEIAHAIYGLHPADEGTIAYKGVPRVFRGPKEALRAGITYIPEDRKSEGLFLSQSLENNIIASILKRCSRFTWLLQKQRNAIAQRQKKLLSIKASSLQALLQELSGGNQQKALMGRGIATTPTVLILDEPTRGIDIQSRAQIYDSVDQLAAQGIACILISSDISEVLGLSDRILVIYQGSIKHQVLPDQATSEQLLHLAMGGMPQ